MNVRQEALDIEYHRTAAATYDAEVIGAFSYLYDYTLHPWIDRLVSRIPSARALDLGCGTGLLSLKMEERGCIVTAVDHSPEMLAVARQKAQSRGLWIRFSQGDIQKLPDADASYDAVSIHAVLHHLSEIGPALNEAVRVLRPGGELFIAEPCLERSPVSVWLNAISGTIGKILRGGRSKHVPVSDHEGPLSGKALIQQLRSLGLEVTAEYMVTIGAIRFLPFSWRLPVARVLSWPTRHSRGDFMFAVAKKS